MSQIEALVTSSVLCWARESSGLSINQVAEKLKRPYKDVEAWELGQKNPSIPQARKLSELYRRPLALFYLPEPPIEFDTLRDFRCLPGEEPREFSKELRENIRLTKERQQWVRSFLIEEGVPPIPFASSANLSYDASTIAEHILQELNITSEVQCKARSRDDVLRLWISRAESKGIYIFRKGGIELTECRGFILTDDVAPFIYLNSEDAYAAQLFTLVHELAHLWLGTSCVSNMVTNGFYESKEAERVEVFCNEVASLCLLDIERFMGEWSKLSNRMMLDEKIERMSQIFKVSEEAIARRLLQNNIIAKEMYEQLRQFYQERWIELKRQERARRRESKSGPSYYVTQVSQNGLAFTQTVVSAYSGGNISGRDASSLLGVKVNNLVKLARQAGVDL